MVKIRLKKVGKKHRSIYNIVVSDSRSPRDGKFIEKLGTYNPNTDPASIILKLKNSISWLIKGAQPTNTVKSIFYKKGVWFKKHLLDGVKKGVLTEKESIKKFDEWKNKKNIQKK